jgi:hypothetical protein
VSPQRIQIQIEHSIQATRWQHCFWNFATVLPECGVQFVSADVVVTVRRICFCNFASVLPECWFQFVAPRVLVTLFATAQCRAEFVAAHVVATARQRQICGNIELGFRHLVRWNPFVKIASTILPDLNFEICSHVVQHFKRCSWGAPAAKLQKQPEGHHNCSLQFVA